MKYSHSKAFAQRILLTLACGAILGDGVALAQDQKDESFSGLEEVIVTATKRTESLQEVGMSITALSNAELERMGAYTLLDFAVRVPNLGMAYEADGRFDSSSPSIRGIFGQNTTGFYIDDTPVNASLLPRVLDVERIEVLRGPQGSLYGAKSMGGTIRMITKQPDLTQSENKAHASLSTVKEGDQNYNFDASFNIPVVEDKFALRVAAYYGENSGIFDRVYIPTWVDSYGQVRQSPGPAFPVHKNVDDEKYYGGQIAGKIAFTDSVTVDLKLMGQKIEADGLPFADIKADNTTEKRFFDQDEPGADKWYVASGTLNWDTSAGQLTSTTSWYDHTTNEWEEETTFLNALFDIPYFGIQIPIDPLPAVLSEIEKYQSFVQEIRFASSFDGPVNFIAGVFYQDMDHKHRYPPAVQTGLHEAIDAFTGVPGLGQNCEYGFCLGDDDLIYTDLTFTKTKEYAVFGELTYQFSELWSITVGGRYYDNKVSEVSTADGFANSGPSSYDDKQSESGFNPKVLVEANVTDDINVYATAAKGFRIGGVNGNLPVGLCGSELAGLGIDPSNATTYDSDSLWSYELGFKSSLADKRVTLNGAAFFIDWSNIQQFNRLTCGFQFTQNAGKAESKGFELELNAAPTKGLTLSAAVGYTKAEITDSGGVAGVTNGDKIQGVPDWTVSGSAQYNWPAFDAWEAYVRADANYYGDSYSSNNETSAATQRLRKSWSAFNLRLGIINEKWDLTLFADNVTDERANLADSRSIAAETPGRQRLVVNRPRTLGIEARVRF